MAPKKPAAKAKKQPKAEPVTPKGRAERESEWLRNLQAVPRGWVIGHMMGLSPQQARDVVALLDCEPMPPEVNALALMRVAWHWLNGHRPLVRESKAGLGEIASTLSPSDQKAMMDVRLKELQYLERCGELVSRRATERFLRTIAEKIKRNGEIAQREFGRRGWELAEELLQEIMRETELFSADHTEGELESDSIGDGDTLPDT